MTDMLISKLRNYTATEEELETFALQATDAPEYCRPNCTLLGGNCIELYELGEDWLLILRTANGRRCKYGILPACSIPEATARLDAYPVADYEYHCELARLFDLCSGGVIFGEDYGDGRVGSAKPLNEWQPWVERDGYVEEDWDGEWDEDDQALGLGAHVGGSRR